MLTSYVLRVGKTSVDASTNVKMFEVIFFFLMIREGGASFGKSRNFLHDRRRRRKYKDFYFSRDRE